MKESLKQKSEQKKQENKPKGQTLDELVGAFTKAIDSVLSGKGYVKENHDETPAE